MVGSLTVAGSVLWLPLRNGEAQPQTKADQLYGLHREAVALYRAGRYERAARHYHELVKLHPGSIDLLKDFMWVLWRANHKERASEVAVQIIFLKADDTEAWNFLGSTQMELGRRRQAIQAFETSLQLNPTQLRLWRVVAQLYLDLRQYDQAIHLVSQLLQ
ncbi:MAG: tetratricopeptide repeat protein, partial [Candidatus Omnitrophica bacterium]|nr:tetratricopeptide repeat protein [Candidatus Omnitrophota bacterium]